MHNADESLMAIALLWFAALRRSVPETITRVRLNLSITNKKCAFICG